MSVEENIISYVRIRPVPETDEKILEKIDDKSVIIARTNEKFSFGNLLSILIGVKDLSDIHPSNVLMYGGVDSS